VAEERPEPVVVRTSSDLAERQDIGTVTVEGVVRNGAGNVEPGVEVRGCGTRVATDGEGRFSFVMTPGECTLWARRVDGVLPIEGPRSAVLGLAGQTVQVFLDLPEYPQGLAGVFLGIGDGANRVVSVAPGSPAESQGVRAGHLVLEIDGENVQDLDAAGLWQRLQGDADSAVLMALQDLDGGLYRVELKRDLVGRSGGP
jgi:membrane-associated protease RseP (regulator of RpoE activity)